MMRTKDLVDGVPVFLAVAEARSFTRAARTLGMSPSAASQAVRALEARLGTPLITSSTRSLNLTAAGAAYAAQAGPALAVIADATRQAIGKSVRPSGRLRLTMPRAAYDDVVAPGLADFRANYPDVQIEIEIDGRLIDIVARGFDAGLRYGDLIAKGMDSVRVSDASSSVLTAAPAYLARRPAPLAPSELVAHEAIVCRSRTTRLTSPWVLTGREGSCRVDPRTPTIASDLVTQIDLTLRGHGISCTPLPCIDTLMSSGSLVRILPTWSTPLEPLHIYFPSMRSASPALRAFVEHLLANGYVAQTVVSEPRT